MKTLLSILFISSILSACELGDNISKCNLDGYEKDNSVSPGEFFVKQTENKTESIYFENKILTVKKINTKINDFRDYNNNDTVKFSLLEVDTTVGYIDSTGETIKQFKSYKDALSLLDKKYDVIKMDNGKIMMVNSFIGDDSVAAKSLICSFNEEKSNCNTCNFVEGTSHSDNCEIEFVIKKVR